MSQSNMPAGDQGIEGVAGTASARVGEILAEAERDGLSIVDEAERAAAATREAAEEESERITAETREKAREAAGERAARLAELQSALTARGSALVEGLEGAGLTRSRLEALIEALAATAERLAQEAEEGDPRGGGGTQGKRSEPDGSAAGAPEPASDEGTGSEAEADETAGDEEGEAEAAAEAAEAEDAAASPDGDSTDGDSADGSRELVTDGNGNGSASEPARYDGPLPEGAPLARKPPRSPERDARFAALLLAVKGRDRGDVETHLRREFGVDDCAPILDEVFGPTHA